MAKKAFNQAVQRLKAKGEVSLSKACRLFGISRQGYYQKQQRVEKRLKELSHVKAEVIKERIHLPRLGTRKLYYRLGRHFKADGIKIGRDALFAFLRSEHMLIKPKRSYHKTTNSKRHANGYKPRAVNKSLIHHSDRGLQYCSSQYQQLLAKHKITPSMTDGYDCYQNALAERMNGIIKEEFLVVKPADIGQARSMIRQAVDLYNNRRPHLALNYQTPNTVHKKSLPVLPDKDYL